MWPGLAPLPGTGTWPETQYATATSTCMLLSRRLHSLALSGCTCPAATLCAYAKWRACAWPSSSLVPSCDIHRSVEVSSKYQGGSGEAGREMLSAWDRRAIASTPSLIYSTRFTQTVLPARSSWMRQAKSGESDRIFLSRGCIFFFFFFSPGFPLAVVVTTVSRCYQLLRYWIKWLQLRPRYYLALITASGRHQRSLEVGSTAGAPDQQPA